ncbi:MAG: hypothetical protein RBR52_14685 [Thiomonas sp.]|uniref:hypothetical protein n=1 Tax=Thiomonas sp. TaxID=2047785 RepID=UPI002A35CC13|nr:hypothetical protein [Thiomonas sp.]MDY0331722.1 hypothetical protein [Thiomonas sp.]
MSALPAITQHVEGTTRFLCPHCRSDDVRKVSLMYEQATSNLNYRALSMNDQGGAAYTAGSGGLQNLMGGRIAPPVPPEAPVKPRFPIFSLISLAMATSPITGIGMTNASTGDRLVAFVLYMLLPMSFLPKYVMQSLRYASYAPRYQNLLLPDYQQRHAKWSRSWMCMRCGEIHER